MTPDQVYTNIRVQCNESGTNFLGETELYAYMTMYEHELADEVGCTETTDSSITTVASTREYTIPAGTLTILRCEWNSLKLQRIDLTELDQVEGTAYGGTSSSGSPIYYYVWGTKIGFSPIPDAAQTAKLWINKEPTALDSSSSAFTVPSEYGKYIIDPCLGTFYAKDKNLSLSNLHFTRWEGNKKRAKAHWWKRKFADKHLAVKDEDNYPETDKGII